LATGQGASSVGLTASVRKDPVTKEWTLEGGALVLADKGICLIDEFDKMNDKDRTSIHEAMEQQSISISKAGIVASLHARCCVLAAANPVRGRYNPSLTFAQNVNLSDPIISRFDILCIVKDVIEQSNDEKMARFVIESHAAEKRDEERNRFEPQRMIMSQDLLKKYIMYARMHSFPIIKEMDRDKISKLYSELRKESMSAGSIPITVRHVESVVRISEAFARMKLKSFVSTEDIDEAIKVVLDSFMGAQKYSITKNLRKKFNKYIGKEESGGLYLYVLNEMIRDKMKAIGSRGEMKDVILDKADFERKVKSMGLKPKESFYTSNHFKESGCRVDERSGKIVRPVE
jgi:DNA replication licensing factor MCM2